MIPYNRLRLKLVGTRLKLYLDLSQNGRAGQSVNVLQQWQRLTTNTQPSNDIARALSGARRTTPPVLAGTAYAGRSVRSDGVAYTS